jgi:PTH2 family peptidyl-tRNA hydrolase
MNKVKQVIVMRTDLNMRKGKMVAQGAHASMKIFFDRLIQHRDVKPVMDPYDGSRVANLIPGEVQYGLQGITKDMEDWIFGSFTKVCVGIESEAALMDLYDKVKMSGMNIPCALITDSGLTEFGGVPTVTCCAFGPINEDQINPFTGHLKLL